MKGGPGIRRCSDGLRKNDGESDHDRADGSLGGQHAFLRSTPVLGGEYREGTPYQRAVQEDLAVIGGDIGCHRVRDQSTSSRLVVELPGADRLTTIDSPMERKPAYTAHMGFEWLILLLPLLGHVLYGVPPDPEASVEPMVSLHNGDDFSIADEAPHPERLQNIRAVTGSGEVGLHAHGSKEGGVGIDISRVAERPCWVAVETPPVFIEIEAVHFHRYLQHEGLQQVIARRLAAGQQAEPGREIYSKYVKIALNDADGTLCFLAGAIGLPIEIVPVLPGPVGIGERISVCVLVDGKPAADLQVRASHRALENGAASEDFITRTDQDGVASIGIHQTGLWRLHTIAMEASADPQTADWISIWASLTFRI